MSISKVTAFFSYAHKDDTFGFLTDLRNDLCAEYNVLTGDELDLFFDRTDLTWGERWRKAIEASIDTASLFIPVLSPNYFGSPNCIQELKQYLGKVERSGAKELILPLMLVSFDNTKETVEPGLIEKMKTFQYHDIHEMRLFDRGCGAYRKALNTLATGIYAAERSVLARAEEAASEAESNAPAQKRETDNDEPFFLESATELEGKITSMLEALEDFATDVQAISPIFDEESEKLNSANATPKEALVAMSRLAKRLEPIATHMNDSAERFATQVAETDPHVNAFMSFYNTLGGQENPDPLGLLGLQSGADETKANIADFLGAIRTIEKVSRVLYKPLKVIERATTTWLGTYEIVLSWSDLVPAVAKIELAPQGAAE